ncbi:hypothetical protein D8Y22_00950 [Salinadaptatus halalkaliphilus]|uniref:DUF8173 domain-containing protein n=1 Tax=Salinadaptatus halalkaliphilus TaxID=2419781 RepID=A0A4S3TTI2_9EURY|nr:hypothetical protein [Salinadaptatus halalkaliphilus]THE66723.1 hypothetical protein D8Y22_00950 [Salinadaptatus halalkaliphilus]
MSLRHAFTSLLAALLLLPGTAVAQADGGESMLEGVVALVVIGLLIYGANVVFSAGFGLVVMAVSTVVGSGSYVRSIEHRIYDRPVRSSVLGIGALVGGLAGLLALSLVVLLLVEVGLPEPTGLLIMIPFLLGMLFVYVGVTLGMITIGAYLLGRLRGGEANLWLAVVVGALVVNIPGLNLVLGFVALFTGTGAMVGHLWQRRRGGAGRPDSPQLIDG